MKLKVNLFLCMVLSLFLAACGGGGSDGSSSDGGNSGSGGSHPAVADQPGKIPGMGETPGSLQGTSFKLPAGVVLLGDIGGALPYKSDSKDAAGSKLIWIAGTYDAQIGSGSDVSINLRLMNKNATAIKVVFPVRLIAKPRDSKNQVGILLKETSITLQPNVEYSVALLMYCAQRQRIGAIMGSVYDLSMVSDSSTLKELTDLLVNKKINVEEYGNSLSDLTAYSSIYQGLSTIVWNLTDYGVPLSNANKQWIASIPSSQQ
jgi:hypothetical protein